MNRLSSTNAVVLDLGGPILPVEFLADMRRYTRARLEKFVLDHAEQPVVAAQIAAVAKTTGDAADDVLAAISALEHWCDEVRSAAPLMAIEEMIWKAGFEAGALRTPIYDDAFQQMRGWVGRRVPLYTFSTAPASIQRLALRLSDKGDLTALIAGYFDPATGKKLAPVSYTAIARQVKRAQETIVFFSDAPAELRAARDAGLTTVLVLRPDTKVDARAWDGEVVTKLNGL